MARAATPLPPPPALLRGIDECAALKRGFTLIEMLVVLSIIGVLMGISIGAFRRATPSRDLARNAVLDALRQTRLFAIQESAPATVRLEVQGDLPPTVTAVGKKTVATWHLEDGDADGFPQALKIQGGVAEATGVIGHATRLADGEPSFIDGGVSPSFDTGFGFAGELFVKFDALRSVALLSKGKGMTLRVDSSGALTLQVRIEGHDEKGEVKEAFASADSARPVLHPGVFAKVAASFDGLGLRIAVDDVVVAETLLVRPSPFRFDGAAPLLVGTYDQPAGCVVDELKWAIYAGLTQELRDVELAVPLSLVRFGPDGALDPQFHSAPAQLVLRTPTADPDHPTLDTTIRIGLLGDVH